MVDENDFYKAICYVQCGADHGSGFLINRECIVTADHVITEHWTESADVFVRFEGDSELIKCKVDTYIDGDSDTAPLAILRLPEPRPMFSTLIGDASLQENDTAQASGYFTSTDRYADRIALRCVRTYTLDPNETTNVSFSPIDEKRTDFSGFSGAPIIFEGHIIGILQEQRKSNQVADRIRGFYGLPFRECLKKAGITVKLHKQIPRREYSAIISTSVEMTYTSESDLLLSDLFESILADQKQGNAPKIKTDLLKFLRRLPNLYVSDEKKAEFYYRGALWLLLNRCHAEADYYYQKALQINPQLNDKVYRAYELLNHKQTTEAMQLLRPISCTLELNAYLSCMEQETRPLAEMKALFEALGISADRQTYRLLALSALRSDKLSEGESYLKAAFTEDIPPSQDLLIIQALFHYWDAMKETFPEGNRFAFAYMPGYRFFPNIHQQHQLETSYTLLEQVMEEKSQSFNPDQQAMAAWGLVILSDLLPGKDTSYWLEIFHRQQPCHPLGILFALDKGYPISEENCEEFLAELNPEFDHDLNVYAKLRLLLSHNRYQEAKDLFTQQKENIARCLSVSEDECRIQLLIQCKEYTSARNYLKKSHLPSEASERYELLIRVHETKRVTKSLAKQMVKFAAKTKLPLDFYNASILCRKHKKWKEALTNAKLWWKVTEELTALEALVESLYESECYEKCLKAVEIAEQRGGSLSYIQQHKMNSLVALARYDEARAFASTFIDNQKNARYAVWQAKTFLEEGQPARAIGILRGYADQGLYDLELYQMLVVLIQGDHPDLAYHYANSIYLHDPDNPQVIRFAGNVALMTGHDSTELSFKFIEILQKSAGEDSTVRIVNIEDIQDMLRSSEQHRLELVNAYNNLECPIHILAEQNQSGLGGTIWSHQHSDQPYFGRFGLSNDVQLELNRPLLLDYTACLTLCSLNLFNQVCSAFNCVWIEQHLLVMWLQNIHQLKTVHQNSMPDDLRLSEMLQKLTYHHHPQCEAAINCAPYKSSDYIIWQCALENHAYIIDESPFGELTKTAVPDGWYAAQVIPNDFYAVLDRLRLPHPDYDNTSVNEEVYKKIIPHCSLVLSTQVLAELIRAGAAEDVFSNFHICLPDEIIQNIHNQAQSHHNREAIVNWLETAYSTVANAYRERRITLKPFPHKPNTLSDTMPYTQSLEHGLHIASEEPVLFAIDDRCFTSYHHIRMKSGASTITATYDILTALHKNQSLGDTDYFHAIDELLAMGYSYFLPNAEYLISRLILAKIDDNGILVETEKLQNIRRLFSFALGSDFSLYPQPLHSSVRSEIAGYLQEWSQEFIECLRMIWKSHQKTTWCIAASNWLITHLGDFLCDTNKINFQDSEDVLALHHVSLLTVSIALPDKEKNKSYLHWINPRLLTSWRLHQGLLEKTAKHIVRLLGNSESNRHNTFFSAWLKSRNRFILSLPYLLRHELIKNPEFTDLKEYCNADVYAVSALPPVSTAADDSQYPNTEAILVGNADAMEQAILFLLADINKHADLLLELLPVERLHQTELSFVPTLIQFFSDLTWYFPVDKRYQLQMRKHVLSVRQYTKRF